jgi:DNA-directed RNA polymerase specialized sigma24 family protein
LERCYASWPRLRSPDAADAYVRRTIVNTYVTWRRRRSWHEVPRDRMPEPGGPHDAVADVADRSDEDRGPAHVGFTRPDVAAGSLGYLTPTRRQGTVVG